MFKQFIFILACASIPVFLGSCAGAINLEEGAAPSPQQVAGVDPRNLETRPRRQELNVGDPVPRLYFRDQYDRELSTRELTLGGDALLIFFPGNQSPESRSVYKWIAANQNPLSNHIEILLISGDSVEENLAATQSENLRLAVVSDPALWGTRAFGLTGSETGGRLGSTWSVMIGKEGRVLAIREGFFDLTEIRTTQAHRPTGKSDNKALDLLTR